LILVNNLSRRSNLSRAFINVLTNSNENFQVIIRIEKTKVGNFWNSSHW